MSKQTRVVPFCSSHAAAPESRIRTRNQSRFLDQFAWSHPIVCRTWSHFHYESGGQVAEGAVNVLLLHFNEKDRHGDGIEPSSQFGQRI